jgi:hypothetical protein
MLPRRSSAMGGTRGTRVRRNLETGFVHDLEIATRDQGDFMEDVVVPVVLPAPLMNQGSRYRPRSCRKSSGPEG